MARRRAGGWRREMIDGLRRCRAVLFSSLFLLDATRGEGKTGIVIISEAEIESLPSVCAKAHNVDSCEGRRWVEGQGRGDVLGGCAHCARTTITSGLQYMITAVGSVRLHSLFSPLAVPRIPRPSIAPPGKCRRAMCPVNSSRLQSSTLPARLQTRTCRHPHARSAAAGPRSTRLRY
jgi:hypothetical protein